MPLLAAALLACQEKATGPSGISVTLKLKQQWPATYQEVDQVPTTTCQVELHTIVTGSGRAMLEDALLYFAYGTDRTAFIDTVRVPANYVAQIWGTEDIHGGGTWPTVVLIRAGAPFTVKMSFIYRETGKDPRTADLTFDCGAKPPAAAPPTVSAANLAAPAGQLLPGSVVSLNYSAESPIGVWQTVVSVRGACNLDIPYADLLNTAVFHDVRITLPDTCKVNEPIEITIHVRDANLVETTRQVGTLTIVDVTPPVLTPDPPVLDSMYFVGDAALVTVIATDDVRLSTIIWEVLPYGVTDSVHTDLRYARPTLRIPLRPEWVGEFQVRIRARDAAGLYSNVVTTRSTRLYPTTPWVTRSVVVPGNVRDFTIDLPRNVVYLLKYTSEIDVLSLATTSVTRTITLTAQPKDADLTLSGDTLVIVKSGAALELVDLRTGASTSTTIPLALPQFSGVNSLRVAANGKAVVVAAGAIYEVAIPSGALTRRDDAGAVGGNALLARSHDRSTLVFNPDAQSLERYDAATDQFMARKPVPAVYDRAGLDAQGNRILLYRDVYDRDLVKLGTIPSPLGGFTEISPDANYVYTLTQKYGMIRSRTSDGAIVDRTVVPANGTSLHVSADGSRLVMVSGGFELPTTVTVVEMR